MSLHPAIIGTRRAVCRKCDCGADPSDPCAACARHKWFAQPGCKEVSEPVQGVQAPPPSLTAMAVTATAALAAEASAILRGEPAVSDEEIARRLGICQPCGNYQQESKRCSLCGCFLKFKTALRSQNCPAGKW